jgi:hypothetical protein
MNGIGWGSDLRFSRSLGKLSCIQRR